MERERERERERKQHAATWVEEEPELQNQAGKLNIEMTYCTPGLPCACFWYLSNWSSSSTMFLGLGCCVERNGERWIFMWCQSTSWDFFHRCFLLYLTMGLELLLSEIWNLHSSIATSHLKILQACFWRAVEGGWTIAWCHWFNNQDLKASIVNHSVKCDLENNKFITAHCCLKSGCSPNPNWQKWGDYKLYLAMHTKDQ